MRVLPLTFAVALSGLGLAAALPASAQACSCRVGYHHAVYRHYVHHVGYVRHVRYARPYGYGYAAPAYYGDYAYDPYVTRTYYDWTYASPPTVWSGYGSDYGGYDGDWRWRHSHWRGHWHDGDHGHWDHGHHRGWDK